MSEQKSENNVLENFQISDGDCRIKLHAVTVAQIVGFAFSIVVLILEIIFSASLMFGFACLGMCFIMSGVEKWLTFFTLKNKNDLLTALVDSAAFVACVLFVVLGIL